MFESLFPSLFFVGIHLFSFSTAYGICYLYNQPFFHPNNDSVKLREKTGEIVSVIGISTIGYQTIYFMGIRDSFMEKNTEIYSIIKYILIIEFLYYWIHRGLHTQILYKNTHAQHHTNHVVYPIDFLEIDVYDNIGHMVAMNLPLGFIPISCMEYVWIYYFYMTMGFLVHSEYFLGEHAIHHRYFKYNYCLLIPVYDILFGTYRR